MQLRVTASCINLTKAKKDCSIPSNDFSFLFAFMG